MRSSIPAMALMFATVLTAPAWAGYPFFSKFTTQSNGAYAPRTNRYIVVDPAAVANDASYKAHHHAGYTANGPLWTRHDVAQPVYPYGWFGARAGTRNWSHVGYYDDYVDQRFQKGF